MCAKILTEVVLTMLVFFSSLLLLDSLQNICQSCFHTCRLGGIVSIPLSILRIHAHYEVL